VFQKPVRRIRWVTAVSAARHCGRCHHRHRPINTPGNARPGRCVGSDHGVRTRRDREPPSSLRSLPNTRKRLAAFKAAQAKGEDEESPQANCVPPACGDHEPAYPIELLFTSGKVTIVIEAYSQTRRIFPGRPQHPDDPDLTYNGHSIGHWAGDTLVVDSVGFTPDTALGPVRDTATATRCTIVERFRLTAPDTLEVVTTVDDASAHQALLQHEGAEAPSRLGHS